MEKKKTTEKQSVSQTQYHSELVDLPSGGRTYPADSPLASGKLDIKYMTTKAEDILTSQNLIKQSFSLWT